MKSPSSTSSPRWGGRSSTTVTDSNPATSLHANFREWLLPEVFRTTVRTLNHTADAKEWLADRQLDDLRDQLLRHPSRTLLEANEAVQKLLFKAQVDANELTGEPDPVVQLIDFAHPERNVFQAVNQFRIDTPGCVKACIIPDIVLFVNGIPLVVVEAKIGDPNTVNSATAMPAPKRPPQACAKADHAPASYSTGNSE